MKKLICFWGVLTVLSPSVVTAADLLDTYQLALDNDPVVREAEARRNSALENRPQSIARLLPTLRASAASSRNRLRNKKATFQGSGTQHYWANTLSLDFSQPVFHWDFWVQLSQADNIIAQAEADYQAAQQDLMVRTSDAYFNVLAAQDNLEFATAEKTAIARQLEQAKQRFEVGLIAITDVHEAQAGYDQARANEILAENELDNAKEALREIIGNGEVALSPLGQELPLIGPDPRDIEQWSSMAEKQNLSIISAQNQAETARKTIEIQRSGHYPVLDLVASHQTSDVNSTFGLRGETQSIGLELNVPLFEGGAVTSRTRQAIHDYQAAKEQVVQAMRAARRQVKDAYRGVNSTISQVKALKAAVVSSESALEATEAGFEVGTRTMVDVLAEQRNLFAAKRDYARTRYDYILNGLRLKQGTSSLMPEDLQEVNSWLK